MSHISMRRLPPQLCAMFSILSISAPAYADVRAGVEVGINVSSLSYNNPDAFPIRYYDLKWRPSFTGGATLELPIRRRLGVLTALRYIQQGNRIKYDFGSFSPRTIGQFR